MCEVPTGEGEESVRKTANVEGLELVYSIYIDTDNGRKLPTFVRYILPN